MLETRILRARKLIRNIEYNKLDQIQDLLVTKRRGSKVASTQNRLARHPQPFRHHDRIQRQSAQKQGMCNHSLGAASFWLAAWVPPKPAGPTPNPQTPKPPNPKPQSPHPNPALHPAHEKSATLHFHLLKPPGKKYNTISSDRFPLKPNRGKK